MGNSQTKTADCWNGSFRSGDGGVLVVCFKTSFQFFLQIERIFYFLMHVTLEYSLMIMCVCVRARVPCHCMASKILYLQVGFFELR